MDFGFLRGLAAAFAFSFFLTTPDVAVSQTSVATPIATNVGVRVQLDPTDGFSLASPEALRAEWVWVVRPGTSVADFSDPAALRPFVTIDVPGSYEAQLNLFPLADPAATEPVASTTLMISTDNVAPVALIQARGLPGAGSPLVLDGTRSYDVDGDALTYAWSVVSAPAGHAASFDKADQPISTFSFDLAGLYAVQLSVQDTSGASASAVYEISVSGGAGETDLGV